MDWYHDHILCVYDKLFSPFLVKSCQFLTIAIQDHFEKVLYFFGCPWTLGIFKLGHRGRVPISKTQYKKVMFDVHMYMGLAYKGMMSGDRPVEMAEQNGNKRSGKQKNFQLIL